MSEILLMVKRVSIFLLGTTILTRLFGESEYKKYMEYAVGLILIAMVSSPVLALFGNGTNVEDWLSRAVFDQKAEETVEEIKMLGKSYEKTVWEHYREQVQEDVALQCGIEPKDCLVSMDGETIERIEVRFSKKQEQTTMKIKQLAMRYGIDEDCIYFIE